jgi:DNA recombination protein RmuC
MELLNYSSEFVIVAAICLFALVLIASFNLIKLLALSNNLKKQIAETLQQHMQEFREFQIQKFSESNLTNEKSIHELKGSLVQSINDFQQVIQSRFGELKEALLTQQNQFQTIIAKQFEQNKQEVSEKISNGNLSQQRALSDFKENLLTSLHSMNESTRNTLTELRDKITQDLNSNIKDIREELNKTLNQNSQNILKGMSDLTQSTDLRLKEISGQVEKRLSEGFEKTTQTFNDVLKRLALIDDAQKKITELSTNVVSLQQVLADKRSRGAFGEVQLNALIKNVLPENHYAIQHKLSNDKVADCILFLPEPTGNVVIDAKFPLESYQKMTDFELNDHDRQLASRQFRQDIKKHIKDIKEKYIIEGETASGAMMFIPAEAVFAEIHAHFPDLVELAHKEKVWLVSPTTMMAILTTASAVIKDEATRKQVHIIQEHLSHLSVDFARFRTRMDNLSKHIGQVSKDVNEIHTSAKKITKRFDKIERVELLDDDEKPALETSQ